MFLIRSHNATTYKCTVKPLLIFIFFNPQDIKIKHAENIMLLIMQNVNIYNKTIINIFLNPKYMLQKWWRHKIYYRWCHVKIYGSCCKYHIIGCLVVSYRRRIWRNIVCKTWRLKISGYGHNYFRCICLFWIRIIWDSDIKLKRKEYYIYIYLLSFCYQRILIFLHLKVWTFNIDCGLLL